MVNLLKLCLAGLRGEETEAAMVNYLIPTFSLVSNLSHHPLEGKKEKIWLFMELKRTYKLFETTVLREYEVSSFRELDWVVELCL